MLKWYYYVLFAVVALSSLSMTWWSMYDLGVSVLSAPILIAAVASSVFDIAGIYLCLLSIEYAKTDDSGFWTELSTYLFIAGSTYVVIQHGVLDSYPIAGIVMFAAAPIALAVILRETLKYLTRQQRKAAGRVTNRLPSVGWLTWFRYRKESWKLISVAMRGRIVNAADKLELSEDRHDIFGQNKTIRVTSVLDTEKDKDNLIKSVETTPRTEDKSVQQLSQPVVRKELVSQDKLSLPIWLPNEPDMKLSTLVRTCLDNGVLDLETIFRYAKDIKGQEVNKMSLSRTLTREKTKIG